MALKDLESLTSEQLNDLFKNALTQTRLTHLDLFPSLFEVGSTTVTFPHRHGQNPSPVPLPGIVRYETMSIVPILS